MIHKSPPFTAAMIILLAVASPRVLAIEPATQRFTMGPHPGAPLLADLDADGKLDIAVTNAESSTVSWRSGSGDGGFGARHLVAAGPSPVALAGGDLDADGRVDLVVANRAANTISVLRGSGSRTFLPPVAFDVGERPCALGLADFDHDGHLDLAVCNFGSPGANVYTMAVLRGVGDGSFDAADFYETATNPSSLVIGDFDHDGIEDLVICCSGADRVSPFLGTGDGHFRAPPGSNTVATGPEPGGVALLDVDRDLDHDRDIVVTQRGVTGLGVHFGNGNGYFPGETSFFTGSYIRSLEAADLDGDGWTDLVLSRPNENQVIVLASRGSNRFGATLLGDLGNVSGTATGQLGGAAFLDLVVCDDDTGEISVQIDPLDPTRAAATIQNDLVPGPMRIAAPPEPELPTSAPSIAFAPPVYYPMGRDPRGLWLADLDGDLLRDAIVASPDAYEVLWRLGRADGTFGPLHSTFAGPDPVSVGSGDLDGDGRIDLVVANRGANTIAYLRADAAGGFEPPVYFDVGERPIAVVVRDTNRDNKLDVLVANNSRPAATEHNFGLLFGNGDGTLRPPVNYAMRAHPVGIVAGNTDNDQWLDVIVPCGGADAVVPMNGWADGLLLYSAGTTGIETGAEPTAAALAEMNRDFARADDIVIGHRGAWGVTVHIGDGGGAFPDHATSRSGAFVEAIALGDFDRDRNTDVVAARPPAEVVTVLRNVGSGSFAAPVDFVVGHSTSIASADLDRDGFSDVVGTVDDRDALFVLLNRTATTPVLVQDLRAVAAGERIRLHWHLAGEELATLASVTVERSIQDAAGPFVSRSPTPLVAAAAMQFEETWETQVTLPWYRIVVVEADGTRIASPAVQVVVESSALRFALGPAEHTATDALALHYTLPGDATGRLEIFDARGRRLWSAMPPAGHGTVLWDQRDSSGLRVARGLVVVRLTAGSQRAVCKVILQQP